MNAVQRGASVKIAAGCGYEFLLRAKVDHHRDDPGLINDSSNVGLGGGGEEGVDIWGVQERSEDMW